ncbi:MAG: hypothetical protein JWQ10_4019 [Herbaspirillum sp.]|jgi:hypothetical protein|nr:hypothetical protein [Herbaspirillum sp.]
MQKAALLGLLFIINSSAAIAAAPIFQLHEKDASPQLRAIDAYPSKLERDSALRDLKMPSHTASIFRGGAYLATVGYSDAGIMPAGYSYAPYYATSLGADVGGGAGPVAASTAGSRMFNANDSLFYFLKNFKARPLQKPATGTLLLIGLCFLLYQIRRRPMRAAIGFHETATLIGTHATA